MDCDYELKSLAISNISDFDGNSSIHDFLSDCERVLSMFDNEFEQLFLKLIRRKLKNKAFESIKSKKFERYIDFKIYLLVLFRTSETLLQLIGKLGYIYQYETETVLDFALRIRNIGKQIHNVALCQNKLNDFYKNFIEESLLNSFLFGLKLDIDSRLRDRTFDNFHEAIYYVVGIEKDLEFKNELRNSNSNCFSVKNNEQCEIATDLDILPVISLNYRQLSNSNVVCTNENIHKSDPVEPELNDNIVNLSSSENQSLESEESNILSNSKSEMSCSLPSSSHLIDIENRSSSLKIDITNHEVPYSNFTLEPQDSNLTDKTIVRNEYVQQNENNSKSIRTLQSNNYNLSSKNKCIINTFYEAIFDFSEQNKIPCSLYSQLNPTLNLMPIHVC